MKKIALLLLATTLTACTPYVDGNTPFSIYGGYTSKELPGGVVKVEFDGNAYTSMDQVVASTLRRAAELAQDKHMPYFAMYGSLSDIARHKKIRKPVIASDGMTHITYGYFVFHPTYEPNDFSTAAILQPYQTKR